MVIGWWIVTPTNDDRWTDQLDESYAGIGDGPEPQLAGFSKGSLCDLLDPRKSLITGIPCWWAVNHAG